VFTIKSNHGYDKIIEWARSILPERNRLKENFYAAKSMMKPLGLGYQKIDICPNFCMLYYLENVEMTECMTCRHSRYKPRTGRGKTLVAYKKLRYFLITSRLQRLFMSPMTAEHMTWHNYRSSAFHREFENNYLKCHNYRRITVHRHFTESSKIITWNTTITDAFPDGIKFVGHLSAGKITDKITDGLCECQRVVH